MRFGKHSASLLGGTLMVCLAWGTGCDEDGPTENCAARLPAGTIHGRVDVGGLACAGRVVAHAIGIPWDSEYEQAAMVADDGSFVLRVPYGAYALRVELSEPGHSHFLPDVGYWRGHDAWVTRGDEADTLRLGEASPMLEIDFIAGSLEVTVNAPAQENGANLSLRAEPANPPDPSYSATGWRSGSATITDGVARFELPGVLPGAYRVRLDTDSPSEESFYLPGTRLPEEADTLVIEPGKTKRLVVDLGTAAGLSGSVRGSWQILDCALPAITCWSLDSARVAETRCDPDGSFALRLYRPEPLRVHVAIEGTGRWIGGGGFGDAQVFTPQAGGLTEIPELVESGLLVRVDLPEYDPHVMLRVVLYDALTLERVLATKADQLEGSALVCPNLRPGDYRVFVDLPYLRWNAVEQWFDRAEGIHEAAVVTVPEGGQAAEIRVTLEPGGTICGRLHVPDDPCPAAVYYFVDAHTGVCVGLAGCLPCDCMCICEEPEPYCARGLPAGDYKVGAALNGFASSETPLPGTLWYPGTTDWEAAGIVHVEAGATVTGIDITAPR